MPLPYGLCLLSSHIQHSISRGRGVQTMIRVKKGILARKTSDSLRSRIQEIFEDGICLCAELSDASLFLCFEEIYQNGK
jgi:hypothetical protein